MNNCKLRPARTAQRNPVAGGVGVRRSRSKRRRKKQEGGREGELRRRTEKNSMTYWLLF